MARCKFYTVTWFYTCGFIVSHSVCVFPFHKWFPVLYLPVLQEHLVTMSVEFSLVSDVEPRMVRAGG